MAGLARIQSVPVFCIQPAPVRRCLRSSVKNHATAQAHPGKRFHLPRPVGSADALLLARLGEREKHDGRVTAIVTADAADAHRLMEEMAFFAPELRCALFPDWETLPYDSFSPHQDLISERLATLWRINQRDKQHGADVVIVPATTALYRLAPPSFLAGYTFEFKQGQKLDEAKLKAQLTLAGYQHVSQVVSHGEYAVRGGLIDLFPMGSLQPYRVDLFDDEIDSIRTFDPDTQRSLYPVPEVRLLPGREFPMDEEARAKFRSRWRELLEGDPTRSRIYKDMGAGIATAGIEYYLPLFFDETATVFDYLGDEATVVLHGDLEPAFQRFWQDTKDRYRLVQGDPDHPALPPETLFLSADQFYTRSKEHAQLALRPGTEDVADSAIFQKLEDLSVLRGADDPLAKLQKHIAASASRVLLLAESDGRRESLLDFFRASGVNPPVFDSLAEFQADATEKVGIATSSLMTGFAWVEEGLDFVTETELFASSPTGRRRRRQEQVSDVEALIKDLSELKVGDPIVHADHGIGRYRGLINMDMGQKNPDGTPALQEFLHLEYAADAVLYVPVSQLHLISRYTGVSPDDAPLHKLGGTQWEKAKRKAAEQVRDSAAELLNIYARRAARQGHAFRFPAADYEQFVADFGFEETADQRAAIHAVVQDMISPSPWTAWSVAMWASARPRSRCARPLWRPWAASRSPSWPPPRCWPSSITRPWWTASPNGRSRWPRCRAFARARRSRPPSRASRTARWISWSARTSCCPSPRSSRTWACSSSTRNTALACATRRP
jgi:transcription-repair coupling factor (superfamily II helicase)